MSNTRLWVMRSAWAVCAAIALAWVLLAAWWACPLLSPARAAQPLTACFYTEPATLVPLSIRARSPSSTLASLLADASPLPLVADCAPTGSVHYLNAPDAQGRCRYLVFDAPRAAYPFSPGTSGGTVTSAATFAQAAAVCAEEDAHEDDTLHLYRLYLPQAHAFDANGTCSACGHKRQAAAGGGGGGAGAGGDASGAGGGAGAGGDASGAGGSVSGGTARTRTGTATVGAGRYRLNADGTAVFAALANRKLAALTVPKTVKAKGCSYRVTAIGANACAKAPKLKAVTVKAQVVSIGKKAFYRCARLGKATVRSTALKTLGAGAFKGCARLRSFACASRLGKEVLRKAGVL